MTAIVTLLNRPYNASEQTKAEFTAEAVGAGFDMAAAAIEAGVSAERMEVRASMCPDCGCADIDMDASEIEEGKLVCWNCGTVYTMEYGNSIPAAEADYSEPSERKAEPPC